MEYNVTGARTSENNETMEGGAQTSRTCTSVTTVKAQKAYRSNALDAKKARRHAWHGRISVSGVCVLVPAQVSVRSPSHAVTAPTSHAAGLCASACQCNHSMQWNSPRASDCATLHHTTSSSPLRPVHLVLSAFHIGREPVDSPVLASRRLLCCLRSIELDAGRWKHERIE